jgi:hypothetical protein
MNIYWKGSIGVGVFNNSASWVQSAVPGESDIAEMTQFADIIVNSPVTVLGVNIGSGATLDILTNFTATEGTPIGANRGTIKVFSGAELTVGGTLNNSGTVSVGSGTLAVQDFDLPVTGGGVIDLGGTEAEIFIGAGHSLSNINNTISGQGTITDGGTLVNQPSGIIAATHSSGTLFLDIATRNQGTIEAISAGTLQINASVINNTGGGVIRAVGSSTVGFGTDSTIIGGTVTAQPGGTSLITGTNVTFDGGKSVVATNTMITLNGEVDLNPDAVLNLKGTINNSGLIDAASATLVMQTAGTNNTVTLKGSGQIELSGGGETAQIIGGGSAVTFDNVNNKINGGGTVGGAGLKVKNEVGGIFDAVPSGMRLEFGGKISGNMRLSFQAARSIG